MYKKSLKYRFGFSIIEIILSIGLFAIFSTGVIFVILQGLDTNRLGVEETIANQYASEGIEASRSIKNQSFASLLDSVGTGVKRNAQGQWIFGDSSNIFDKYTRVLTISNVQRDFSGNIVQSGGVTDPNTKKVTSVVTWNVGAARTNSVELSTYFTNWKAPIANLNVGGVLVYGDGGTTSDAIKYRLLDGTTGTWNTPSNIYNPATNQALRIIKIYASSTRNEKIIISRHYNGANQFIYGQVFNGSTWGNRVLLASWSSSSFINIHNFDGTYLQNGDFVTVYSDNTNIPKFRVWKSSDMTWLSQMSTQNIGGIPNFIITRARPGTNEIMAVFFDQNHDVNTEYFNGGNYTTANWILHPEHSAASRLSNNRELIAFEWNPNNVLVGGLAYANRNNDRATTIKIWTANNLGAGTWSNNANTINQGRLDSIAIAPYPLANAFITCSEDLNDDLFCFKSDFTPIWTTSSNNILTRNTDSGIQRSFDIGFEKMSGATSLAVYSDTTSIPKLKKYNTASNSWDLSATSLNSLNAPLETVSLISQEGTDDIMIILGDNNRRLYSSVWDGTNNSIYTFPSGKAFSTHGVSGSSTEDYWYDFAWDKF